jgi:hypothetical protein
MTASYFVLEDDITNHVMEDGITNFTSEEDLIMSTKVLNLPVNPFYVKAEGAFDLTPDTTFTHGAAATIQAYLGGFDPAGGTVTLKFGSTDGLVSDAHVATYNSDDASSTYVAQAAISMGTVTPTGSTSGGTLAAAEYFYVVTALTANGESLGSTEVNATTTGSTSSVALAWSAVTGAISYKIYRSTTTGTEKFLHAAASNSFTDTGAYTPTTVAPPTANTTADLWLQVGGKTFKVHADVLSVGSATLPLQPTFKSAEIYIPVA